MAFNLTNLGRKIANVGSYLNPVLAPARAVKTVSDVVSGGISKDRLRQGVNNFLGGVNDTMNLPAVTIGEVGAYVSPKGSRAESEFKRFADTARRVTDMGQDYRSPEYVAGRVTPFVPAVVAAPYLAPEVASVGTVTAVNNVPVATILDMGNLDKREAAREGYSPVIRQARDYAEYAPDNISGPAVMIKENNTQPEMLPMELGPVINSPVLETAPAATRKTQIANSFRLWQNAGIDLRDPGILPIVRSLISEYNSL